MNRWFVAWVIGSCAGLAGAAPASPSAPTLGCLIASGAIAWSILLNMTDQPSTTANRM